jgi:murein DD-endopeptidase MepM/ murein hydrolase activator NlpD
LFVDGQEAGLPDRTIMELTDIFGWDVDFALDLREGDTFSVIYEEIYKNGEKIKNGRILAAEFVNQGRKLRAVYYEGKDGVEGYFSDKGDAMRKAFLRTPVNFTRITSRFSLARAHPILNTIRAHKGVDYAAPTGTPVRATADGKIAFVGQQMGYGNVVVMQHGDTYSTLYGHMSRFAGGVATGKHVRQGQTIGYVGQTGLATGPHLHYEFRINGVHRDPLAVKLPNSIPLDKRYFADFEHKSASMFERLNSLAARQGNSDNSLVAQAGETPAPSRSRNRSAGKQAN